MPVSKRKKVIKLTKVKKNSKVKKQNLLDNIRSTIENFTESTSTSEPFFVYLLSLHNQRNSPLKTLRNNLLPGRVFYGKNKVMQMALGTKPEDELYDNIHKIANKIVGEIALLITSEQPEIVLEKVQGFKVRDFAKSGNLATETIVLKEGGSAFVDMPGNMEPQFRQLGMPTSLKIGKIVLMGDYIVCEKDKPLTPNQAYILKLLGIRMALFSVDVICYWSNGTYKDLQTSSSVSQPLTAENVQDVITSVD